MKARAASWAAALCLLAAAATGQTPAPADGAAERLQLADGLFARGMYALAAPEYEAVLAEAPGRADQDRIHFRLGECRRHTGDLPGAERAYRTVLQHDPESEYRHRAGFRRAGLFMTLEDYPGAAALYRQVLAGNPPPDLAGAAGYLLGESLLKAGDTAGAEQAFEAVRGQREESEFRPYALLQLGRIRAGGTNATEQADALALFREVAAAPPDARVGAEARYQEAECQYRRGAYAEAAEAFRRLAADYPDDARVRDGTLHAAWSAFRAGLAADALRLADTALADGPDAGQRPEWLYLRANCLRQLLRYDEAAAAYALLLQAAPESTYARAARYERALALYRAGDFRQAVAAGRELADDAGLQPDVDWLLAESYAALDQPDEAIQYYRRIARDYPASDVAAEAAYRLAYHLQARGDFGPAATEFAAAAARAPAAAFAPRARFAAGYCFARAERHAEAVREWDEFLARHADDPLAEEAWFQKAMSEIRLGRAADALRSLRALQRAFPASSFGAQAAYWEGRLLREDGRLEDAEQALRRALDRDPPPELAREAGLALAAVLQQLGRDDEAADGFQALLATPAREQLEAPLLEWLAGYRLDHGQPTAALEAAVLLTADRFDPAWQQAGWWLCGRARRADGDLAQARRALEQGLGLGARTVYAIESALLLGELDLETGDAAAAAERFRQAGAMPAPEDRPDLRARAYHGMGRAAMAGGQPEEAARFFMSVAILYDDPRLVPDALTRAAEAFRAAGDEDGAARALAERAERAPEWEPPAVPGGGS